MSVIKTSVVLADAELQYSTSASAPANQRREALVPLTPDGTAVRVASSSLPNAAVIARTAAVLTGAYVAATGIDMAGYNNIAIECVVSTPTGGDVASVKMQWSIDNSVWWDEAIDVTGTASGTDALGTLAYAYPSSARILTIAMDTAQIKGRNFTRRARYARPAAVGGAPTTALLAIRYQLFNN